MEIFENGQWLPLVFGLLFAVAILAYTILDGYDLGVGILMQYAKPDEQDVMIASIGPYWDANETWLVLAVGLLLIAFPQANGVVSGALYLPLLLMLVGLIFRGVSFDLRAKAVSKDRPKWNTAFIGGSFLVAITQGYMMGSYVLGFENGLGPLVFCLGTGLAVAAAYALIGASWLLMKTDGALRDKAVRWARRAWMGTTAGIVFVFSLLPMLNARAAEGLTTFPALLIPSVLAVVALALIVGLGLSLKALVKTPSRRVWVPFILTVGLFKVSVAALAFFFYPYIVPDQLLIIEAASAPESLMIILVGALIALPLLFGYTFYTYKVFHGKANELTYN